MLAECEAQQFQSCNNYIFLAAHLISFLHLLIHTHTEIFETQSPSLHYWSLIKVKKGIGLYNLQAQNTDR